MICNMGMQTLNHFTDGDNARKILTENGCTCVLCKDSAVYTTTLRGVKPLVQWLESGMDVRDFSAADKVVGKATAFLYCLLGVREVYAQVMSEGAQEVLKGHGICAWYDTLVKHIVNRKGDGICPFEAAVWEITDPEEARTAILAKMKVMGIQ